MWVWGVDCLQNISAKRCNPFNRAFLFDNGCTSVVLSVLMRSFSGMIAASLLVSSGAVVFSGKNEWFA